MDRRDFLKLTAASVTLASLPAAASGSAGSRFPRLYAPHFGMFRSHAGPDPLDQIRFIADEGFGALEDCGLRAKPPRLQQRIGHELARRKLTAGCFVGLADFGRPTFASGRKDLRKTVLADLAEAVETAQRVGGRYFTVVPGKQAFDVPPARRCSHAVDNLQFCADVCERHGLTMLLEPIDHGAGRPRMFLNSTWQAARLCRRVARPSCRLLFDVHQRMPPGMTPERLLASVVDVVGYVQLADAPGRKEPGTGRLNFSRLFAVLDAHGYRGLFGMEHGNAGAGREGERAVIEAYASLDATARHTGGDRCSAS
jgi:hydroxypyruvate isomerase